MNYNIILDEKILRDFIDQFLPNLEEHETFYISLMSRKKYSPDVRYVKSDKSQLKRFTTNKMRMFYKIRQLECTEGSYRQFQDEQAIPQEALALYINPNPRDNWRATLHGLSTFAKLIELGTKNHNPHQEILSCVQQTCSRKIWTIFDIDSKDENVFKLIDDALGGHKECRKILETRGGFHILVELSKITDDIRKTWYQKMAALPNIDVKGDMLIPVPGCTQGMFTPRFLDI